jgi:hypothetical protein
MGTFKQTNRALLVKHSDNLPQSKTLNDMSKVFSMFNEFSPLLSGWFIQPFHISISAIAVHNT